MTRLLVTGVSQVGLYAPDLEALARFYRELLGLHIIAQSKQNDDGTRLI
jgi:catechol 2,3-dioxygenase-like lactoylglutathione lyase family enzyme